MSRWSETLAAMPKLTTGQADAVKSIIDQHLADLASDFPKADDAVFMVQRDLDTITAKDVPADPDLGKIGPGHVCKHNVRWPHACEPCADAAWKARKS